MYIYIYIHIYIYNIIYIYEPYMHCNKCQMKIHVKCQINTFIEKTRDVFLKPSYILVFNTASYCAFC